MIEVGSKVRALRTWYKDMHMIEEGKVYTVVGIDGLVQGTYLVLAGIPKSWNINLFTEQVFDEKLFNDDYVVGRYYKRGGKLVGFSRCEQEGEKDPNRACGTRCRGYLFFESGKKVCGYYMGIPSYKEVKEGESIFGNSPISNLVIDDMCQSKSFYERAAEHWNMHNTALQQRILNKDMESYTNTWISSISPLLGIESKQEQKPKGGFIMSLLKKLLTPDLALLEKHALDGNGNLNLSVPEVQEAILSLIQPKLIELLKEKEEKAKKEK